MKHLKKILALCLSLTLLITLLTACGNKDAQESGSEISAEDTLATQEPDGEDAADTETDAENPDEGNAESDTENPKETDTTTETKPSAESNNTSKPSGSTNKPSGSTSKPSGSTSKPSGNTNKPSGNTNKPSGGSNTTKPEKPATVTGPTGTPTELIDKLYAKKSVELMLGTVSVDLSNADAVKGYLGLSDSSKIKEAAASEALIGSQAYSLAVVRVKNSKDAASVAASMKSGINPRKWVCVEADDLSIAYCGDVVMLIMVQSSMADMVTSAQMVTAFQSVCGTQSVTTV